MNEPGRNDPCPCGSGHKFKRCCGASAASAVAAASVSVESRLEEARQHHLAGRLAQAEAGYRRVLADRPDHAEALHLLGTLAHQLGQHDAALPLIAQAVRSAPDGGKFYNLGLVLRALGQTGAALESFEKARQLLPEHAEAHFGMAVTRLDLGLVEASLDAFRDAMRLAPDRPDIHSGYLLAQQYLPHDPLALRDEHEAFGRRFETPLRTHRFAERTSAGTSRRLRVGFVSGDFRTHPVGVLVQGVLSRLPSDGFDLHFYPSFLPAQQDPVAAALQSLGRWTPIDSMSDETAAQRILADGIDILVDLSGHTGHNRLTLFAHRPAPLQVSWLGYIATTGLRSIDYLICDEVSVPPGAEDAFVETLWRIPGSRLCFTPPDAPYPLSDPPVLRNGYPTFGCFNNLAKVTPEVLALWGRVLASTPRARLLFKGRQLDVPVAREALFARVDKAGIDRRRIDTEGFSPRSGDYYDAYGRVDVALDPFPFTGGTTTLDSIWMGVPVVTLVGDSLLSRQSESILRAIGTPELVAEGHERYLGIAQSLASDPERLRSLRPQLRERLLGSTIGDPARYAQSLAEAFRGMWATKHPT